MLPDMTTANDHYTPLANSPANKQPEHPVPPPPRYADWMSYAVAVTQQAAPTAATGFSSDSES
jgi:hypothetical protein